MRRWNSQKKSIRILSTRKCKTLCVIVYHIWLCTYLGLLPSNFYLQFGGKSMGRVYSNELGSFFCQQTDFFSVQRLQCVTFLLGSADTHVVSVSYLCHTSVVSVISCYNFSEIVHFIPVPMLVFMSVSVLPSFSLLYRYQIHLHHDYGCLGERWIYKMFGQQFLCGTQMLNYTHA